MRWDKLTEVALMTTSRGPVEEDVFFVLSYEDDTNLRPAGEGQDLLPGFDNETFIHAMGVSEEGISVLWRR